MKARVVDYLEGAKAIEISDIQLGFLKPAHFERMQPRHLFIQRNRKSMFSTSRWVYQAGNNRFIWLQAVKAANIQLGNTFNCILEGALPIKRSEGVRPMTLCVDYSSSTERWTLPRMQSTVRQHGDVQSAPERSLVGVQTTVGQHGHTQSESLFELAVKRYEDNLSLLLQEFVAKARYPHIILKTLLCC